MVRTCTNPGCARCRESRRKHAHATRRIAELRKHARETYVPKMRDELRGMDRDGVEYAILRAEFREFVSVVRTHERVARANAPEAERGITAD